MIGLLFGYWVDKYCLLYRCKRPIPGSNFVNKAAYQAICLGGLVYSFGSLTWFNISPKGIPK